VVLVVGVLSRPVAAVVVIVMEAAAVVATSTQQMRERRMNEIKETMAATDEEWQVLAPKIEKVMTAQRDVLMGMMGGRRGGGFGGGGGGNNQQPQSPVGKAAQELRDVLQNKDASAESITEKLTAFRDAKKAAQTELETAQKDLKEMLTARQEAVLVSRNMLD
jgi:hypothetical protein